MAYGQYSERHIGKQSNPLPRTSKRRKEVFPTDEIPHIWFHQTNKDQHGINGARNPQGNLYTLGSVLYSYRDSYPIARIYEKRNKGKVVLLASNRWSVTTSKHQIIARQAIPDYVPTFDVPRIMPSWGTNAKLGKAEHKENIAYMLKAANEHLRKFAHARLAYSIESNLASAASMVRDIETYCKFFAVRCPKLPTIPLLSDQARTELRQKDAERKRKADENRRKAKAKQRAKDAERLQAWLDGEQVRFPESYNGFDDNGQRRYARLRVIFDSRLNRGIVETSQGATVPLSHAKRVLALLEALYANKREYQRNGHTIHLGNYPVDSFMPEIKSTAEGSDTGEWLLKAGCHYITWSEIQRIAPAVKAAVCETSDAEVN